MTDPVIETAYHYEPMPPRMAAEEYGTDAIAMIHGDCEFFPPELIGTYARIAAHFAALAEPLYYDYDLQCWVRDGRVAKCGHRERFQGCFACEHHGSHVNALARPTG